MYAAERSSMGILPDLKFTEVKKGLEHCLTEFLKTENFRKKNHLIYIENLIPLQRLIRCYGKVLAERFVIPEHCLTEFLKTENFRSIPAPCHARLANSYVPLQNIRGIKNRVKQLLVRYMPKPLFNRIFLVIGNRQFAVMRFSYRREIVS